MRNLLFINGIIAALGATCLTLSAHAQRPELRHSHQVSVLAGLLQPTVLKGGNVEVNYFSKRMSFEYSYGFSLNPPTVGDFKDNKLALHLPYSTGFGIGYRLSASLDIRLEPKLHSWEIYADGQPQTPGNRLAAFRTFTLGVGAYYRYFPFGNSTSRLLQGITTSTSVRYWPTVGSSQADFSYVHPETGQRVTMPLPKIGLANTPLIINVAVGYSFGGKQ